MLDLRGRRVPCWGVVAEDEDEDLSEKGLRDLAGLGFEEVDEDEGMSEGTQRTPGRRPRSLAFMIACAGSSGDCLSRWRGA